MPSSTIRTVCACIPFDLPEGGASGGAIATSDSDSVAQALGRPIRLTCFLLIGMRVAFKRPA
ncbi:hypothetical protein [Massilia pseudoviolaceinigra]|uniref:hypothetical protein n=1 Tax=Massilia pseudoviolaceinigra TaxID=3057165 RepID=UPI0027967085|nr:hypothetical protein [Massilia sp. CCM 9206]MDQ1922303.1 hypothetical protein [Massilia sp. CCM 9206]